MVSRRGFLGGVFLTPALATPSSRLLFFADDPSSLSLYQAVATLGLPNTLSSGGFTGGIQHVSQTVHYTGPSAVKAFRIIDTDLRNTNFSASGMPFTLQRNLYIPGAPNPIIQATYSGSRILSVASGTVAAISDPLQASAFGFMNGVPPASLIRTTGDFRWNNAGTESFPYNVIGNNNGFAARQKTPAASFVNDMSTQKIPAETPFCQAPVAIIGIPVTPHVALLVDGDSLAQSYNPPNGDNQGYGQNGWLARACQNINGFPMPFTNLAIDGNSSSTNGAGSPNGLALRAALAPFFTHYIANFGHNGFSTAAAELARMTTIWRTLKNAPGSKVRHIEHIKVLPQTTSKNNFIDLAGQTPFGGFEPNTTSFKDTFNALLDSTVGNGLLDATYRHTSVEPVNGYWLTDGNPNTYVGPDGTHSKQAAYALMGMEFALRAATWM